MSYAVKRTNIRNINLFALFSFFIIAAVILLIPSGQAIEHHMLDAMCDQINTGVANALLEKFGAGSPYLNAVGAGEGGAGEGGGTIVNVMFAIAVSIGAILMIIYGITHMLTNMERGKEPVEAIFGAVREMFLVALIMINLPKILKWFVKFGAWLIESVMTAATEETTLSTVTVEGVAGDTGLHFGLGDWIKCFAILIIPWILSLICTIIANFIAYSLLIEIAIRMAFSPIAVADIYGEGLRSPGARYLRKFAATYFKIAISLFAVYVGNALMGMLTGIMNNPDGSLEALKSIFGFIFGVVAINFTTISIMVKSGEFANDLLGV